MPIPSVDSGLFIAYILPGVIALWGLSRVVPALSGVFQSTDAKTPLSTAAVVTLLSIVLGIALSIGRAIVIEPTFAIPMSSGAGFFAGIEAREPNYAQLLTKDRRETFQLAIANEQRPYQFSGNAAIAVLLAAACWAADRSRSATAKWKIAAVLGGSVVVSIVLYCGARMAYYRYMNAIAAINAAG